MKTLVAYFSAESGRTAAVAKDFAEKNGADIACALLVHSASELVDLK